MAVTIDPAGFSGGHHLGFFIGSSTSEYQKALHELGEKLATHAQKTHKELAAQGEMHSPPVVTFERRYDYQYSWYNFTIYVDGVAKLTVTFTEGYLEQCSIKELLEFLRQEFEPWMDDKSGTLTKLSLLVSDLGVSAPVVDLAKYKEVKADGPDRVALRKLPGLWEDVVHPVTKHTDKLQHVIINLNDKQRWTREQIADWLETLDIDLRFKTGEENGN